MINIYMQPTYLLTLDGHIEEVDKENEKKKNSI